ncbi:MAG: hypothetical protein RI996_213 [Candidatus Parcubacteria bacterium]|jgi:hypothetical protein
MILDHNNLSSDFSDNNFDNISIITDICKIVILIELARKDMLYLSKDFVTEFNKYSKFDFNTPVSYFAFSEFLRSGEFEYQIKFDQLLFNLELLIVKLYIFLEADKKGLSNLHINPLRQSFAHRKSNRILSGSRKVTTFGGLSYDFNYFEVMNLGDNNENKNSKFIPYKYSSYVEALLESIKDHALIENIKQLRALNKGLHDELFAEITYN